MSKGKFLTKKKWRNGQRQKGRLFCCFNYDQKKYPRNSRFMKLFDGTHLAMRMSIRLLHLP